MTAPTKKRKRPVQAERGFTTERTRRLQRLSASATKWKSEQEAADARRAWTAARIADFARFTLKDNAEPLTDEQIAEVLDALRTYRDNA